MSTRIYAEGAEDGPRSTHVIGPSRPDWKPKVASRPRKHRISTICRRFYNCGLQRFERAYKRLSSTTRETIRVGISLYAVLYIFFTVPFRIAFYYDPLGTTDFIFQHQWTTELTIYGVMDFIVDLIALLEFLRFNRRKRGTLRRFSSFSLRRTATRKLSFVQPRLQTKRIERGESKWTLASLERSASIRDVAASNSSSQIRTCNFKFLLELVSLVPVEVIPYASRTYNTLHLVRVTKLWRLYRLKHCLDSIIDIYSDRAWVQLMSSVGIKSLVRNIGLYLGLCHYVACGYMLIAHVQCGISFQACEKETSWAIRDRLSGATVARKYARTLYWASRTVMLQGFDDVSPVSDADTIYVIFVTVLGALFVSSLLASFFFIFRSWNARDATFATHVDNAREYMRSQNIPRALRRQVTEYFNYSWNTHQSLNSEETLQLMPKHFQLKVVSTLKATRIRQVCFLVKESVELVNLLAAALGRRVYSPGDPIIEAKLNASMFFVIRGRVIISAFTGTSSKECQTGDFFAETCLLFPEKFEEKAVAKTFCELYVLSKGKFDEAMTDFYREKETHVRDRMAEVLEKYLTQQRKTKKLLGTRRRPGSTRSAHARRSINWKLPGSGFRAYWDTVMLLSIMYVAFEVPYFPVFISTAQDQHMLVEHQDFGFRYSLTLLTEVIFGVKIILRSRFLAHLDPVVMIAVEDPELIFEAYKADGFYLDLIAWFPVGIVLETLATVPGQNYLLLFRLLRLFRLREAPGLLANVCDYYSVSSKTYLVISLLLGTSFMLHIVGCVWFEMAWIPAGAASDHADKAVLWGLTRPECLQQATLFSNCSWVIFDCYAHIGIEFPAENPDSSYHASFAYLRSMYWAVVTLTTVGYGDITAYSTGESYFAAFWIFVGGIINFATVGAMSSTISNAMAPHRQYVEKLNALSSTFEHMDISKLLSAEIRRFYHLEFIGRKQAYESQLLSNLPDQLCYEISSLLHSEAVKSVELFDSASIEFLRDVTGKFRHRNYQNGDTICLEGDICREFLVLLRGSKVNIFFRSRKVPVRALHEGDCYGANEFLLRCAHPATLIAASLVHASVMTRDQFEGIQRKFNDDLKDMKEEAQALLVEQHRNMRRVVHNLEKLKLRTHLMTTSTLFYQGELTSTTPTNYSIWSQGNGKPVHDVYATRDLITALWNAIIASWNMYNAVFIIFRICFHSHLQFSSSTSTTVWIADLSCDACYALDIYLHLYYFRNPEVGIENLLERKEIDVQYLRSAAFKWDVAALLPLYTSYASGSLTASLCRIPRLTRSMDLWTYLDDLIVQAQQHFASHNVSAYLSPVKLVVILVLVAHYVGCVFFGLSEHECKRVERCWINHDTVLSEHNYSLSMLYAKSFYWAITTLLLAGSRDIVPRDTAATLWTGFTCLCCTFIIGHIVGEISDLFQELSKETKQYKNRLANFETFAKEHDLPDLLVKRVGFFFQEQSKHARRGDIHDTVHDLSANLRLKLMIEVYGNSISLLPIGRYLTQSQVNNLALRLKSELFIPGDNILVEGTLGSRLCALRKGLAAAFWTSSVTSLAVLMEGALFGEVAFFLSGQQRLATVQATTSCEVLYVTKCDWQELWTTNGDLSDAQVLRHAQHAILQWIQSRLQRYQRFSLNTANKTLRLLAVRRSIATTATAAKGTARAKRKLSAALVGHKESNGPLFSSATVLPVKKALALAPETTGGPIVGSEVYLLEKKAAYIHAMSDECIKKFYPAISALSATRRSSSAISRRSSMSRRSDSSGFRGFYRNDATTRDVRSSPSNIHALQFMIETNPINKTVRASLTDEHLCNLEAECWSRFRLLVTAEFGVSKLLTENAPPETISTHILAETSSAALELSEVKIHAARNKLIRTRSLRYDEHANRKEKLLQLVTPGTRRSIVPDTKKPLPAAVVSNLNSVQHGGPNNRRLSMIASKLQAHPPECKQELRHRISGRSNSLQHFDHTFFEEMRRSEGKHMVIKSSSAGLDFGLLQRFRHLKYPKQVEFSNWYRKWKNSRIPRHDALYTASEAKLVVSSTANKLAAVRAVLGVVCRLLCTSKGNFKINASIKVSKQMEKSWDLVMLLVAMYHLLVTTFKVSFAADLAYLPASVLRSWSRFETFLDVLCILDVLTKLRRKYFLHHASAATDRHSTLHVNEQAMYADIFAILPFELLLLASDLRVPLAYMSLANGADDASWWTTRWLLRVNRLVFIRRVEPLFEKVLQVVVDKDKMRANEALLYFLQGLATYLTMGHLLACIWVFTSNVGRLFYETSDVVRNTRVLAESTTASYAADISLMHKYLSSLLFAMECISTLFYGDILSMNPVEVATELGITLWSIYIYGALVGAQGELFDSRARREAAFEQTLSQLQRYLVQNEVPKEIKHQVKTYYARLWSCRKGEAEFKAVEQVPRALYEDVVLTTVCSFVVQVKAFEALDDQFLRALLGCLQYVVFSENEEVFVIGDMDRSMYFIAQGRVSVKVGSSESIRERGDFFGELALLYGMARLETCVALTLSELYRLDHEPYERVLLEFPEYRSRNKLDWTTASQNQSSAVATFKCCSDGVPSLLRMENLAVNIESHVPHSYIYHSALELLSKLNKVDPQEAKDLILQGRDGARRRLNAALGIATSRHNDEVRGFHSRSPSQTSREKEDREKRNNDIEQLEAVVAASLKRSESMRPTKTNSLTLQRRQDDSGLPQLRRWSLAITQTEPYSEFVDPVLDPTAIGQ